MDEQTWLTSADPARMLSYLGTHRADARGRALSDRKLRLFACACCRFVWDKLTDEGPCGTCGGTGHGNLISSGGHGPTGRSVFAKCPDCGGTGRVNRSRRAVLVAERYADGSATGEELRAAFNAASRPAGREEGIVSYSWDAWQCAAPGARVAAKEVARVPHSVPPATQAALLRDVFGNPWKPGVVAHDGWAMPDSKVVADWKLEQKSVIWHSVLSWNDRTVVKLAQAIYDGWAFDRLPILADALEDAGCADVDILSHCRSGGPHARGCWVPDLILGKE